MKRLILAALVIGLISACATMGDVMQSKDQGTAEVYPVTFDQAWTIAKTVFRWEGADAIEEHKDERYLLTSSGMDLATVGTVMGAWIDPMPDGQMKVTAVTKRRVQTNIFTTLTETTFHKRFGQAVEIVKSGKALPPKPPEQ